MFKYLIVGDIHATPQSLPECDRLLDFVCKSARQNKINNILLMGDLLDTHAILHSTVINFYFNKFTQNSDLNFICLVGNHDHPLRNRKEHGLVAFKNIKNVTIVDEFLSFPDFDAMPYTDNDEFQELIKKKKNNILLCHHEFLGSTYENGFYSSHGIPLEQVKHKQVISGHIHKIQEFGPIKYVGAPRWMHTSDANQNRGIWLWDSKDIFKFLDTSEVVGKIIEIKVNENGQLPDINHNLYKQVILKVTGTPKFIEQITEQYLGKAEIISNIIQETESIVSETLGVNQALKKFILNDYKVQYSNINNEYLYKAIINRLNQNVT